MGLPVPRAISLGEELSSLTRDDRARLDQILWIAGQAGPAYDLVEAMLPRDDLTAEDRARLLRAASDAALRFGDLPLLTRLDGLVPPDYNLARPISRMDVAEARHAANAVRSLVAESATLE